MNWYKHNLLGPSLHQALGERSLICSFLAVEQKLFVEISPTKLPLMSPWVGMLSCGTCCKEGWENCLLSFPVSPIEAGKREDTGVSSQPPQCLLPSEGMRRSKHGRGFGVECSELRSIWWKGPEVNVFFIYCCIKNYHKLSSLKHHPLIISQFPGSGVQAIRRWVFCKAARKALAKSQVSSGALLGRDPRLSSYGCWKHSVPCRLS